MTTPEQLASELRQAAYIAAAGGIGPGHTLESVMQRLAAVDFMFLEFAQFILHGKKSIPDHGNEPNHQDRSEVARISSAKRVGNHPRDCRCKVEAGHGACPAAAGTATA